MGLLTRYFVELVWDLLELPKKVAFEMVELNSTWRIIPGQSRKWLLNLG